MKLTQKNVYIVLFALLYISVALVSTIHAVSFFGLANAPVLGVMLAITFEIGQAAVLFSILTSSKERSKFMPWCLMGILTLVQVMGNVFSSYKYLITNSVNELKYFKEPIFVWTELPDQQCNVILTYIIGAILPIVALCMTSMLTNYLSDTKETNETTNETEPAISTIATEDTAENNEPTEAEDNTASDVYEEVNNTETETQQEIDSTSNELKQAQDIISQQNKELEILKGLINTELNKPLPYEALKLIDPVPPTPEDELNKAKDELLDESIEETINEVADEVSDEFETEIITNVIKDELLDESIEETINEVADEVSNEFETEFINENTVEAKQVKEIFDQKKSQFINL